MSSTDYSVPTECLGYAAMEPSGAFQPYTFTRRACGENDIVIEVKFAGICHSDIHQVREEWGKGIFPMVPGHEVGGVVVSLGSNVTGESVFYSPPVCIVTQFVQRDLQLETTLALDVWWTLAAHAAIASKETSSTATKDVCGHITANTATRSRRETTPTEATAVTSLWTRPLP
jgi:hypothetical protein